MKRIIRNSIFIIMALLMICVFVGCTPTAGETESEATESEATESEATESEATESEATESEATESEESKSIHIGFSLDTYTNAINATMANLLEETCAERGYEVTITDGEKDAMKQISDVKALIQKGVDGIILYPIDAVSVGEAIEAANEADIPICTVLRDCPKFRDQILSFVGVDDTQVGVLGGEWVVEALGGAGKVVHIYGAPGLTTTEQRTEGFHSVVDKYPDIEIVAEQTANWNRSQAMTVMEAILQGNPELDAVWCQNDEMAGGAAAAIASADREGILLGGVMFMSDAYQRMLAGEQHSDITIPPQMVTGALESIETYLDGGTPEKIIKIPVVVITPENAEENKDLAY